MDNSMILSRCYYQSSLCRTFWIMLFLNLNIVRSCGCYCKDTEPIYHFFMYSIVSLLSGIYSLPAMHSLLVTLYVREYFFSSFLQDIEQKPSPQPNLHTQYTPQKTTQTRLTHIQGIQIFFNREPLSLPFICAVFCGT